MSADTATRGPLAFDGRPTWWAACAGNEADIVFTGPFFDREHATHWIATNDCPGYHHFVCERPVDGADVYPSSALWYYMHDWPQRGTDDPHDAAVVWLSLDADDVLADLGYAVEGRVA